MARAISSGQITPADELRELLTECEKLLGNLKGQGSGAARLLEAMDRIAELWPGLEAAGVDLRPEGGRWETLRAQVHARGPAILRELRAGGGLPALREKRRSEVEAEAGAPVDAAATGGQENVVAASAGIREAATVSGSAGDDLNWWWYLDREVSGSNRRRALRLGIGAAVVILVLLAGGFAFNKLFPVDPKVAGAARSLQDGQQKVADNDFRGALASFQAATNLTPADPQAWLWLGATEQKLGDSAAAQDAYTRARQLSSSELNFHLARGPIYASLGFFDEARADLNAVLAADPRNPEAYYFLAGVEESQGNLQAAAEDLQKAGSYASDRSDSQLTAMSRFRLGLLLQRMQANPGAEATAAP